MMTGKENLVAMAVLAMCVGVTAFAGDGPTLKDVTLAVVNGLMGFMGGRALAVHTIAAAATDEASVEKGEI